MEINNLKKFFVDEGLNVINHIVMESSSMFYYSIENQTVMKFKAIKKAFEFHYKYNDFYRTYCKESGNITPDNILTFNDLPKIPVIPNNLFKAGKVDAMLTLPLEYKQLEFHTEGVQGYHGLAYRDSVSNEYAIIGLYLLYVELMDLRKVGSPAALFLTPSLADAPNLGMLRALAVLNSIFTAQAYAMENNQFNFDLAIKFIKKWDGQLPIFIIGPPFIVSFFIEYLKANNIKFNLGENARIMTAGGWKRHTGQIISKDELTQKICDTFGIKPTQYRDLFGLIELNQFSMECAFHKKHIPPFCEFFIKDLNDTSKVCEDGKEGMVTILDPTVLTYPGFISTPDVGIVNHNYACECGRTSSIINIVGRAHKAEDVNCSITLDKFLQGKSETLNHSYN